MPPDWILLPFAKRRIYKGLVRCDHLINRVKTDWGVELGGIINKCIWNGYESDDTTEVERMKFARDDAEVWDRAKEMIPAFTVKGSAQLSKQHGLLKSTVSFSKCRVVKTYKYAWFKIS